ncbi:MAG: tetratricopeptide repeat protein [candidate division WOR-3 bacterium]
MHSLILCVLSQTIELVYGGGKDYELFQKANSMVAQGRYEEAIGLYLEAIKLYPSFKEAYNNMGVAYSLLGDTTSAIRAFREAIGIDSLYIDPLLNLASCYAGMGLGDSAVKYYNRVLRLDPENPKALSAFTQAQAQAVNQGQSAGKGQSSEAQTGESKQRGDEIKEKEQALAKDPYNPQTYYDIAVLLDKAGRYEEAIDYYIGFLNTSKDKQGYEAMREFAQKRVNELARALRRK